MFPCSPSSSSYFLPSFLKVIVRKNNRKEKEEKRVLSLSYIHTHTNTYILKNIYFQIINVTLYYEATETIKKDRFVLT